MGCLQGGLPLGGEADTRSLAERELGIPVHVGQRDHHVERNLQARARTRASASTRASRRASFGQALRLGLARCSAVNEESATGGRNTHLVLISALPEAVIFFLTTVHDRSTILWGSQLSKTMSCPKPGKHASTHAHARIHARTHTHTHTYIHAHTRTHIHEREIEKVRVCVREREIQRATLHPCHFPCRFAAPFRERQREGGREKWRESARARQKMRAQNTPDARR